jgi:hypothetical protein
MKRPDTVSSAGPVAALKGDAGLLVAEHQDGGTFKRSALGKSGLVRGPVIVGDIEREKVRRCDHFRFGRRNNGLGTVRVRNFLGLEHGVTVGVNLGRECLAVGVGNDAGKLRRRLVLDAERRTDFREAGERILAFRTALGLAFRKRKLADPGQFGINAFGLGRARRVGESKRHGRHGAGEKNLFHSIKPFLWSSHGHAE